MIIGFTGTQTGLTDAQEKSLLNLLANLYANNAREFHHGDCVGADARACDIARGLGYKIHMHPPTDRKKRAYTDNGTDVVYPPKTYLDRNHDIVNRSDALIACPAQDKEILRSGTWATVRYARKKNIKIKLIFPKGDVI